ncbi:MAG TPA: hypothetical protein VMB50_01440 [Myxococcales bacterium]|nr:hypothetical protein [Myxococcales bacterium]
MATIISQPKSLSPTQFEAELTTMDLGVQKYLPATVSLNLDGSVVKQPAIDTQLQSWLQTFKAVDAARQALQDAVKARLAITVEARQYYKALKAALRQYFGTQSATLSSFGIASDKPLAISSKKMMQAVAKRQQTRDVRGTKGKKQKAAITVVGNPPITLSSDGTLQAGPPPVNLPASSSSTPAAPTPGSVSAPVVNAAPAPAAPGSGGTNGGSGTPAA